jgi:formiminoglutamase
MDVFSSSVAPGVSAPTSLGIMPHDFFKCLKLITDSKKLIAFDISEVNPNLDNNDLTSRLAANLIFKLVDEIYSISTVL